jgi:hypothetical protein
MEELKIIDAEFVEKDLTDEEIAAENEKVMDEFIHEMAEKRAKEQVKQILPRNRKEKRMGMHGKNKFKVRYTFV